MPAGGLVVCLGRRNPDLAHGVAASLDDDIESLSAQVNEHLASVRSLERQLLYPTHTRLSVFLSLAERETLDLDAIELFLNDQPVASHLYQNRERSALEAGGVQELYIGNLATRPNTASRR